MPAGGPPIDSDDTKPKNATRRPNALVAWWLGLSPNARGILWITMGTIAFALNDVAVKTLGRTIDPFELAFFRYVTGLVILAPFFVRLGLDGIKTRKFHLHATRLVLAGLAQIGVLISVIHMPLAAVTALSFTRILFTTFVAVWILGELVSGRRWGATAVGFVGVLVMVRPDTGGLDPIAMIAIGAALILFAGPAAWVWRTPVGIEWFHAVAIGLLTTLGMVGFVRGFAAGEASVIGPMEYVRLIYAAILGFAIFAEIPDPWTIVGALIIVAATTYIARDEAR